MGYIYTLETSGGKLIDVVSDSSLIGQVKSPHYILADNVEPLRLRLLELGFTQVKKQIVSDLIQDGFICINTNRTSQMDEKL